MDFICKLTLIILSGSITGSIFTFIWMILKTAFKKYLRTDIIFALLRFVIISYFIPSTIIIMSIRSKSIWGGKQFYLFFTTPMKWILAIILTVIILLTIIKAIRWTYSKYKIDKELMIVGDAKVVHQKMIKEIKEKLGVKKPFEVWRAFDIESPYVYGLFKTKLYISTDEIEDKDMKNILTHELYHIKKGDMYFEPIVIAMLCMNWFNPFSWYLKYQYKLWAEADCDFRCFTYGGISCKEYLDTMLAFVEMKLKKKKMENFMAFGKSQIVERANCIANYSRNKINKKIVTLLVALFLVAGGSSVYAASNLTEKIYNILFLNSCKWTEEKPQVCDDGYIEVSRGIHNDEKMIYSNSHMEYTYDGREIFFRKKFDIPANDYQNVIITIKNINEAGILNINFRIDETNADDNVNHIMAVGIIEPDNTKRYIEAEDAMNNDFKITKTGDYKIFIENKSGKEIEAGFSIIFTPEKED